LNNQVRLNGPKPRIQSLEQFFIVNVVRIDVNRDVSVAIVVVRTKIEADVVVFSVHGVACEGC
jgi:hypothetical protein